MKKLFSAFCLLVLITSCISTRSTLKNVDDKAQMPPLSKEKTFIIREVSSDKNYGYDQDYPVNLGFMPAQAAEINVKRYFGALSGPNGEKISYTKADTCCPFPSPKNEMGAGLLDIYDVTWEGLAKPYRLYINLYERGTIMAPKGFGIREIK